MARKIESQEEQFPDRVAAEQAAQQEEPYLRTTDVDPRIHFMAPEGMDPERAKKFEDAFTRKMVNEVGDPSLPKVPPRGQAPAPTPQVGPQGSSGRPSYQTWPEVPRPDDYQHLEPSSPEEWGQLARTWLGPQNAHMWDTPRKMNMRVRDTQKTFSPWGKENYHPYDVAPEKWNQYADWKRQQGTRP